MPMKKGKKRVHRLVVLPDYQGIGIGTKFIKQIAQIIAAEGFELNLTTTTPALVGALCRDPDWVLARYGRATSSMGNFERTYGSSMKSKHLQNSASNQRITYSFWYKQRQVK